MKKKPESPMRIKWIDIESFKDMEDSFYIRREVFIREQNVPEKEEFDEADLRSHHIVVHADNMSVATGRLFKTGETWLIGRISVLKECRGKHIGKLVLEKLLQRAAEFKAEEVHVHAQIRATDFYRKAGFVTYGAPFLEAGIEHISMVKKL